MNKKVIGIGNALVDIMTTLPEETILKKFNLQKGSMQLIEQDFAGRLLSETSNYQQILSSGGSAANTIFGLANLGISSTYIGKVGNDDFGVFFKNDLEKSGVNTVLLGGKSETGRAIALVSPDSERTFGTFLGAAIELDAGELNAGQFKDHDFLHIEGYLVQNKSLIEKAMQLAKDQNITISIDMASYNVVDQNREFLYNLIHKYVDIVFANEDEARSLTGKEPEEALEELARIVRIAIVKVGEKGSIIKSGNERIPIGIVPAKVIDTTGAGDLYASGFLSALAKNQNLQKAGETGALCAAKVIEIMGARLDTHQWNMIHSLLKD